MHRWSLRVAEQYRDNRERGCVAGSSGEDHVRTAVQWYFPALICTAIWAITSFGGYFWPVWVFFGLTIAFVSSLVFDDEDEDEDSDSDGDDDELG